jgi:hypothetical protein
VFFGESLSSDGDDSSLSSEMRSNSDGDMERRREMIRVIAAATICEV